MRSSKDGLRATSGSSAKHALDNQGSGSTTGKQRSSIGESVAYTHPDPIKQEETMLLYGDKKGRAEDSTVLLTMTASREVFLKRLVFDYFDGHSWRNRDSSLLTAVDLSPDSYVNVSNIPPLHGSVGGSLDVTQEITASVDLGHVIPAADTPQRIQFPTEQIFVDKYGSLRTSTNITAGTKYKVISKVPIFDPNHLQINIPTIAEEQLVRAALKSDLQIPADLGVEVGYLAKAIVGREQNWFAQAQRICDYLRNNFTYSLKPVSAPASANLVRQFLFETKRGDCTHFASAFVMLCRNLGIPSRCVGGFVPGTKNLVTGLTEVRWRESHAWAEVFIPGYGWVPFDAVPGGYLPAERSERSILASLGDTQLAKSLAQIVDNTAKAKGLQRFEADSDIIRENSVATPPIAANYGKGTNARQEPPTKITRQTIDPQFQPDHSLADLVSKPVLRLDGQTIASRQKGWRLRISHLCTRLLTIDLSWLAIHWQRIGLITAMIAMTVVALNLLLLRYDLLRGQLAPNQKTTPKYSTLSFMRVMKDLARLKVKREKGETATEVVAKVVKRLAKTSPAEGQAALPELLSNFMDLYCLNRFRQSESPAVTAQLQHIEKQIHTLLTSIV